MNNRQLIYLIDDDASVRKALRCFLISMALQGDVFDSEEDLLEHGDSLGNKGAIQAGDIQWMTAGSGIVHQEMPGGEDGLLRNTETAVSSNTHEFFSARAICGGTNLQAIDSIVNFIQHR